MLVEYGSWAKAALAKASAAESLTRLNSVVLKSKIQLQGKLNFPGIGDGAEHFSEGSKPGGRKGRIWVIEVRVVKGVEELGTKFEPPLLFDGELLEHAQINSFKTGSVEGARSAGSKRTDGGNCKGCRIEEEARCIGSDDLGGV